MSDQEAIDAAALDQMEADILGVAEGLVDDLPDAILEALQIYAREIASKAPRGKTGNLRNSIRAIVVGNQYGITMEYYGYFQNFGVSGTENNIGLQVPSWSPLQPRSGNAFKFTKKAISPDSGLSFPARRTIARFGITPKRFFLTTDQDMTTLVDRIFNIIENQILQDG
jgi:hypothetical protein